MRVRVVKIGRVAYPALRDLTAVYLERLRPFARVESVELKDDAAALRFLSSLPTTGDLRVNLDERGELWDSTAFSAKLGRWRDDPTVKAVTFLIGGPMGLAPALRREAQTTWSLTRLTMTSDMAWLLCWEQLYRAMTILEGGSYHHD